MDDTDLAGPIVFCFLFASVSLLVKKKRENLIIYLLFIHIYLFKSGKLYFGYIYGVSVLACLAMYSILNLMSVSGIDIYRTTSVLGYCLLPMVLLCSLCGVLSVA
jgi:hypothetical protein